MASVFNRGTKDRPSWWAKIKDADGEWRSAPTHQPNKEAAKRWANAKQADVENTKVGILPRASQPNALTVRSLFERFLAEYEGPKIRKTAEYRMQRRSDLKRRIVPYSLAAMPAQKVRTVDIERWRDALRKQRLSHSSINGTLARLSTTFAWAIRNEILSGPNPCVGVQRLPTKPRQDCYSLSRKPSHCQLARLAVWPFGRLAVWPFGRLAVWPLSHHAPHIPHPTPPHTPQPSRPTHFPSAWYTFGTARVQTSQLPSLSSFAS